MRPNHPVCLRLRRTNRYTRRLAVPAEYLQRHGLGEGDEVEWNEEADGTVRLRFIRQQTVHADELTEAADVEAG
jgi:hypothetical protein